MAKKKQRINLIDRNGNSQVVQVNSSDLYDSENKNKKTSVGSTIKNATSGGIAKKFVTVRPSGGTNEQNERNYGALVNASNTNTVTPTIRTSDINANLDKKENQRLANRQYNEALSNTLEARNDLSKKAFNEMKEQGAETDNRNLLSQDKRQLSYETKNKGKTAKDIIEENNEKIAKASENTKEKYKKEIKDLANKENELTYAKYQKDYWDVQNDDIDTVDKTLGIVPNALSDYFSSFTRDQQTYTDENGNELVLPTKSEMKREKTLENIKNPVGRWLYQVGHEGTKQAITQGLNMSGLPLGSALYYGDILTDTYNENLNSGENKTRSIIDAVAKTGQSYIKQKILGGIGGKLTGNNSPSWLEKALSKKFGEFIENPAVTTLLGSATAEGIDEFTDSYIEKALDAAILSDNKEEALKRIKEVFSVDALKEAAYEGSIGMGTGAIGNIDEAIDAAKTNRFLKKNGIDIKQARQIAQTQTAEEIQKSAVDGTNEVMNQVQQGNITEQQGQQFLDIIQRRTQAILDLQQSMQGNQQNTFESKLEIVKNMPDVEKAKLVEIHQKIQNGEQLNIDEIAAMQYFNSKGTPQAVENTPIQDETTRPNAIPQETQNNTQNREINNNYASQDLEGPPVEEERTPYSKQMTQEEADEMQRAHSESLDRMADGRVGRTPGEQLIKDNNVSDRRVNAIQYDNPEVKKYYRDAAEIVGAEADMARENAFQSGIREQQDELGRTEYRRYAGWNGFISKDLNDLARNGHLTAKQIEKAADDIIEDNGKENNANAKKLEKILDKRLREGYSAFGDNFEPNQDYINEIENIAFEKQRQGELESLEDSSKTVETNETTQNNNENKQESTEKSAFNLEQNIGNQTKQENIPDKVEDNVITIKNDDLKDTPKDQIKAEDTGISIGNKPVKMEIPIDSKKNKIGQYVPKNGFTQKELKDGKIGDSKFYRNVTERADFINDEVRKTVKDDDNIKHYRKVTNEESMQEAFDDLNTRGTEAIAEFFNTDKELTAKDTAMGWLLIAQSQANGDYNFSNQVLRKMHDNATKIGQAEQMYNYYARLTPEGMYRWCGDQLLRAEEIFEKGKTKKWIEQNKDRWQLNGEEVEFINKQMERIQELNKMNDNDKTTIEIGKKRKKKEVTVDRAKQVEIAKIQAMIENKIPPQKGQALNAWMRISMLGNLKTIATRNPLGNIALRPINDVGDFTASIVDYAISKKTGVRTKGNFNPLAQAKGMARGASETIQDARLGINTRNVKGNRFEIGQGKSFNEHHKGVAKVLNPFAKLGNKADSAVSFLLDLGDRPFYEATYQQSLENQMKLNKIDKLEDVPQWMKSIAEQEALERTYQDDNNYTSAVIDIRRAMNKMVNVKGYGLGDVIIPFAKTPANLTKAIVDYSPAGFVNALTKGKELRRSIQNGQFTPEIQHAFVNQLGKAMAGTMLYGIGAALANSGIITGGADEDKDVADFMRNTLGIQPYSIVIGDKSFTYDWAQPVASALAIPADIKKGIEDAKEGEVDLQYIIHKAFSTSGNILLEQSFLQGIKEVLGGYGDPFDNLMSEIEGLPARAVPTLVQQIVTYFDPTKRMSYGNNGIQNVISQAQAKTPWASDLPKYRNSMGKEIQMYGGKNSFFNVFLNPANYSEGNATESAEEIYRVYQATNKKEILPRLVDKNIKNEDGTKLTNEQKSEWLRISGGIIDREVEKLTKNGNYLRMSDEDKADTIKAIVDYAYNEARNRVTGHELSSADRKASNAEASGYALADYFISKTTNKVEKTQKTNTRNRYMEAKEKGIDGKTFDDFHAFVASARGESRTGGKTKKQKIIDYIQGLPLTREQKEALYEDYQNNQGFITYYK